MLGQDPRDALRDRGRVLGHRLALGAEPPADHEDPGGIGGSPGVAQRGGARLA